jgi:inositol hexakisphosphate/diphosphoinositol-pentakisphosphate kinase
MKIKYPEFLAFFNGRDPRKEIKIKKADQMQRVLDITRELILKGDFDEEEKEEDVYHENNATKLLQLQSILEKGGHFDEITRKIQLRPLKYIKTEDGSEIVLEALMILKWGGELTHSGEHQAEEYGKNFR